jgi:CHAD domain-containing protein
LRANTRRLLLADIGVRRRDEDAVHQMRVACRRMRSDLKTFRPLVEEPWGEVLRTELKWLADSLGDARDLEVLRDRLAKMVHAGPPTPPYDLDAFDRLDAVLRAREDAALDVGAEALRSERYLRLLDVLVDASRTPFTTELAAAPCSKLLPGLVRGAWDRLAKRAKRLDATADAGPDTDWHEARIKAKQARYAAEATADVLGKPAARLAAAAKAVQEVLGDHQDAATAAETLDELGRQHLDDGMLCLTAGRLVQANRCAVSDTRRAFEPVWTSAQQSAQQSVRTSARKAVS